MIYVLDNNGTPLMPTTRHGHARRLLRDGKAVLVSIYPFIIQLTYESTKHVQEVRLGVDTGTKHVGLSATSRKKELFSAVGELRTNIVDLLSTRREMRRTRRHRLRHRPARFNNRVHSKHKGWLPSSVENRIAFHIKLINMVYDILPVRHVVLEIGVFDIQKINNPDISGKEYQEGEQMGFWNTREYVLYRDSHICQHCKGKSGDKILNVHHIETRKVGGDSPNNLITLCETCHDRYHRGEIVLKVKRGKPMRDAAAMNMMKAALYDRCKRIFGKDNVSDTWGYITKYVRIHCELPKEHNVDARVISGNPMARPCEVWHIHQVRRHNRQIHKANKLKGGKLKPNQAPYLVHDFRLNDIVKYKGVEYLVSGRRTRGTFVLRSLYDGSKCEVTYRKLCLVSVCNRKIIYKERWTA
jgi:hypothetical protein